MRTVTQFSFGGPEVLEVVEADKPIDLNLGHLLVRIHAVSVNPIDAMVRSGVFPMLGAPPFRVGWDISGVVEASAPGTRFRPGDEVYGMPLFPAGDVGYSDYAVVHARHVAHKPASLDHVQAAAVPMAALTAWQSLVERAAVQPGQRVLITRAAGGVGHLAVQIAKARGAEVIALASRGKHEFVSGLGADRVIDYREVDFTRELADLDMVLDATADGDRSLRVLRAGGVLVSLLQQGDADLARRAEACGRRFVAISAEPDYASLHAISQLIDAGTIRPHVSAVLPLAEVSKAHAMLDTGQTIGKIVLKVAEER